jgi:hypothetical protein
MKMIVLERADRLQIEYMGRWYKMEKGVPAEVPHELADRLIRSGDFLHIVSVDQVVQPGVPIEIMPDPGQKTVPDSEPVKPAPARRKK